MAPVTKTSVAPRVAPTSPDLTYAQLGQLAGNAQQAAATVKDLKAQLQATATAFKASPNDAVLGAKQKKLLTATKTALAVQEKADRALSTALTNVAGGKNAREQVAALNALLPGIDLHLSAAQKASNAATAQFVKDTDAAMKAPKNANTKAIAKAEASRVKADQAAKTLAQLGAAKAAVLSALGAKEGLALEQAQSAKVPGAQDVVDVMDLASKSTKEQVRLVGAPVVGVSKEAAVAVDVARITQAMKKSPEAGARMLAMQLQGSDPTQQEALIKAAGPQISKMVEAAQGNPVIAGVLLDAVGGTSSDARAALAGKLAEGSPGPVNMVSITLQGRLSAGTGLIEGVALRDAFKKAGKTELASAIETPLRAKVQALKNDFAEKGRAVQKLNGDLGRLVVGFGPLLPADKRQAAIEAFKKRHEKEYAAFEAAGVKLAPAVQYAMEGNDPSLERMLPEFLNTKAGEDALVKALALQAENKPSLLDHVPGLVKKANEGSKLAGQLSTVMVKSVGMRALALTQAGKVGEAKELLHTLENNAALFGMGTEAMEGLTKKMTAVLEGGGKEAVDALKQEFQNVETHVPGFDGRAGQALKGLGLALSALAVADKIGQFGAASLKDQVSTIAEGLGVGVDGGLLAMEVFGRASQFGKVMMLGKSVSAGAGAVAAVMDGISAVQSFREGQYAEGTASSAAAVGGAILATAAFSAAAGAQVVPVAGQVIGVVLVVGGTVAKWTIEERRAAKAEKSMEDDAQAFLEAAGVELKAADELSDLLRKDGRNVGPFIQQVATALGISGAELFEHVRKFGPDKLDAFVDMSKDWPVDKKGQFKRKGPESIEVALIWMKEDQMLPQKK